MWWSSKALHAPTRVGRCACLLQDVKKLDRGGSWGVKKRGVGNADAP